MKDDRKKEKHDLCAMIIAAMQIMLPIVLVILFFVFVGYRLFILFYS